MCVAARVSAGIEPDFCYALSSKKPQRERGFLMHNGLWNPRAGPMIELDPSDEQELRFALLKAYRKSKLSLEDISRQLSEQYGVELSSSAVSHSINRGSIRFQRALQILENCGETELRIRTP
jgi:hypothetical protein